MRQTLTLGRLFDIRIGVHVSWLVMYLLVVASIAANLRSVPHVLAVGLAATCAGLLFASVVAHELAHALVARAYRVRTCSITLFLFGGVATLESEPPTPRAEIAIALAGPLMSALIAAFAFGVLALLERSTSGPVAQAAGLLIAYLALANGVLAAFNLVPAFPMDGGRVLRAVVWHMRKSRAAATGAASIVGLVLALGLMLAGVVGALRLQAWQDVWYVFVGGFLLRQSWLQFRDSRYIERLERVLVSDVMDTAAADDLPADDFSLASSASALDAVGVFRASNRTRIAVVDAGHLSGWLCRDRMLEIFDRAA